LLRNTVFSHDFAGRFFPANLKKTVSAGVSKPRFLQGLGGGDTSMPHVGTRFSIMPRSLGADEQAPLFEQPTRSMAQQLFENTRAT